MADGVAELIPDRKLTTQSLRWNWLQFNNLLVRPLHFLILPPRPLFPLPPLIRPSECISLPLIRVAEMKSWTRTALGSALDLQEGTWDNNNNNDQKKCREECNNSQLHGQPDRRRGRGRKGSQWVRNPCHQCYKLKMHFLCVVCGKVSLIKFHF